MVRSLSTLKDETKTTRSGVDQDQIGEGLVLMVQDDACSDVNDLLSEVTMISLTIDGNSLVRDVICRRKLWVIRYIDVDK